MFAWYRKFRAPLCALTLIGAFCAGGSRAQEGVEPTLDAMRLEADELFKRILIKPNDLDATFRYSSLQTALGDQEAAIGGLERMLFYNPNLPRVRLELGLLYFKLGSYEMARTNFEAAIASPDTPEDVRERVSGFLKEIDRRIAQNQFSFFASSGLRYQTNANAGPAGQTVRALGNDAVLSSQYLNRPDWNAFVAAQVHHVYDFENQRGDVWETNAGLYYAQQFQLTRLSLGVVQVDTGPRLAIGENTGFSVRPYAIGAFVPLGGRPYLLSPGAGVSVRWQSLTGVSIEPGVEFDSRRFSNSFYYPNARWQNGGQFTTYLSASSPIPFASDWRIQSRLFLAWDTARYKPYAYSQVGIDAGLVRDFESPVKLWSNRRWTFAMFGGYSNTRYKEPDEIVDPVVTRRDWMWRVGGMLEAPIYEWFGIAMQMSYARTNSTLPNFRTNNFTVSMAPTVRF
jgi:hypothetical protein